MWRCKHCGEEILIKISAVKNNDLTIFEKTYFCQTCWQKSEDVEEIAEWKERG